MRNVKIGGEEYRVMATPITLFFYKKEFKSDLIGDFVPLQNMQNDPHSFDGAVFLQITWAMIKTAQKNTTPAFEQWINGLPYVNFDDVDMLTGIFNEAIEGFFRSERQVPEPEKSKK